MDSKLILITLLIKLGVSSAVSSVLARSRRFRGLLFREDRNLRQKLEIVFSIGTPIALGVIVRWTVKNFVAADVAFEMAILMGVIAGRTAGGVGGGLVSLPYLITHEYWNIPLDIVAGLSAGFLRDLAKDREAIWSFSPLFDLSIYRWIRRTIAKSFIDWQTSFFFMIIALQFLRLQVKELFPGHTFALSSPNWGVTIAIYITTVMCVAIALKVLNNVRIEMKLEEQERLLMQARMEALQAQINPHFLFNTLNSVSSLVRFDPDTAREMVLKLANILRRLLRKGESSFVLLREEFNFIDDYLDIEVVRFGRDKLRVVKELEAASLEVMVPNMILQPLVENSIKHGLAPKIDGGTITLRSRINDGLLIVEVEDNGVGISDFGESAPTSGNGIGLANIRERLHVLYSDTAHLELESRSGQGTLVRIVLPIPQEDGYSRPYELRSSTSL
ncbi:MAG TPA: histidine kinase [Candidatus Acidoferrales bacterium]|nr:histidine kinase [Candidatus Acidoferrales bacterium]